MARPGGEGCLSWHWKSNEPGSWWAVREQRAWAASELGAFDRRVRLVISRKLPLIDLLLFLVS